MWMCVAVLHAGDVGQAEAKTAGSILLGNLAIGFRDFPEHVGPLGITGQKHNAGIARAHGRCVELRFDGFQVSTALLLTLGNFVDKCLFALAAVERHSQITGDLTQLTKGETCQ